MRVFHWQQDENTWVAVNGDAFLAFRGWMRPQTPLPNLKAGVHYFVVCIGDERETLNIITHKYMVDPGGHLGRDNFPGLNREDRNDYDRLMLLMNPTPDDEARLTEIREKMKTGWQMPEEAVASLVRAVPTIKAGSAASRFLNGERF